MKSMTSDLSVGWTNDILGSAQQALKHLSTLREQLVEQRHKRSDSSTTDSIPFLYFHSLRRKVAAVKRGRKARRPTVGPSR